MAGTHFDSTNLERRLAQLEAVVTEQQRKLRLHRAIGVSALLLLVGAAMSAAVAQQGAPALLRAQRLEIVTPEGQLILAAGAGINGGRLELIDRKGDVSLAAQAGSTGGQLDLWNAAGNNVLRAGCNEHGGDLAMWNSHGKSVFGAYATARGGESALWNSEGQPAFKAHVSEAGGAFSVMASSGRPVLTGGVGAEGVGGLLTVLAGDGTRSVTASAEADGCGRLDVYNNANNAVFTVDGQRDLGCMMALSNNVGTRLFGLGTRPEGGLMNIMNDRGEALCILGVAESGAGGLTIKNASAVEVLFAGADESRDGVITLRDATNSTMRVLKPSK